ncbi:DUF3822 family protein [Flagellimonas sp.]|uniref:DUF3822 family protein n=1 Tax=Flagellimonas sp. TaxID=2058762 RepID=UPI003B5C88B9
MTEKRTTSIEDFSTDSNSFKKLSIQVGLNGLSFCVLDTISNKILAFERTVFETALTPYLLLKELKSVLNKGNIEAGEYSEIVVIHKNNMFSLVPKALFHKEELANYLKFNTKIMANDLIAYDEIAHHDMINVYVPFTNVNNYIFDLFGEFEFKHNGTVLIASLVNQNRASIEPTCFVQLSEREMELVVISDKKFRFYNHFEYKTKEDFLYYLLFSLEQLQIDLEKVHLKLFGLVEEDDPIYTLCYQYIKHVSVFVPNSASLPTEQTDNKAIDFTVLSSL